ncbi:hypothetical protein [Pseudactinotalea sp. Z1748]|uniref:hypothetical protein n=1 Tax=Pseudactinotalea sp. Z1748 TaxID=3413027 RepID=UPI003C7ABC91
MSRYRRTVVTILGGLVGAVVSLLLGAAPAAAQERTALLSADVQIIVSGEHPREGFEARVTVANAGPAEAVNVRVHVEVPSSVTWQSSEPEPVRVGEGRTFEWDHIAADDEATITISARASAAWDGEDLLSVQRPNSSTPGPSAPFDTTAEADYDCGRMDFSCRASEATTNVLMQFLAAMGGLVADAISGALGQSISDEQWNVAYDQWGVWAGLMLTMVMVVMLYQVAMGLLMQNRQRIIRAVLGGVLAVPIATVAVVVMRQLTGIVDEASSVAIQNISGGQMSQAMLNMVGLNPEVGEAINADSATGMALRAALDSPAGLGALLVGTIIFLVLLLASLLLWAGMVFRDYGLLILAALAPLALMLAGQHKLQAWAEKWLQVTAGLLMAKPLATGIIATTTNLVAFGSVDFMDMVVGCLILIVAAFAPLWSVKLVDFTGSEVSGAMAGRPHATPVMQKVSGPARVLTRRK